MKNILFIKKKIPSNHVLSIFDLALLSIITYGILLRISTFWIGDIVNDGALYASIGITFSQYYDFLYPWSETHLYGLSLTYPLYLAGFYFIFGSSIIVTKIAVILSSILLLLVVYLTTKNIYNNQIGLIITAITALDMRLIISTKTGFSENILILFFLLTIWSMLKGLNNDRYIILFGLFAGLTYITKTLLNPVFVIIGVIGFGFWRFSYMKWSIFKNKYYLAGLLILLVCVVLRYILSMQSGFVPTQGGSLVSNFDTFIYILPLKFFWISVLIGIYLLFWLPEFTKTFTKMKDEYYGFLLLVVISLFLLTTIVTTPTQNIDRWIFDSDNLRYVLLLYVPLMWLVFRDIDFNKKYEKSMKESLIILFKNKARLLIATLLLSIAILTFIKVDDTIAIFLIFGSLTLTMKDPKKKLAIMLTIFLIMGTNAVSGSVRTEIIDSVEGLNKLIHDGDIVALDPADNPNLRASPHHIYPYLLNRNITFIYFSEGCNATYILSQKNKSYQGYELIETFQYKWKPTLLRQISIYAGSKYQSSQRFPMKLWEIKHQQPIPHS